MLEIGDKILILCHCSGSSSDIEMRDGTMTMEHPSPFEYANIEPGQTTDDEMQMAVQEL